MLKIHFIVTTNSMATNTMKVAIHSVSWCRVSHDQILTRFICMVEILGERTLSRNFWNKKFLMDVYVIIYKTFVSKFAKFERIRNFISLVFSWFLKSCNNANKWNLPCSLYSEKSLSSCKRLLLWLVFAIFCCVWFSCVRSM